MTDLSHAIVEAVCNGDRSPAQWYARLYDGRTIYIRYRHGNLSAEWVEDAGGVDLSDWRATSKLRFGAVWLDRQIGDKKADELTLREACSALGLLIADGAHFS